MVRIHLALFTALGLCLALASCGGEKTDEENAQGEAAIEETPAPSYAVGDTVWATYFDPRYVTALNWEKTTVVAFEGDTVTVEFQGFLNEGERDTRGVDWIYPYVEVWKPEKAVPGATVVVEPPGTSFVAYPGVIQGVKEGTYTVGYEVDGVPHTDDFALAKLH
ncbi:MAG: hypothetical protein NTW26_10400 [bacterium]|nr:hypothetical protein [bacterium]